MSHLGRAYDNDRSEENYQKERQSFGIATAVSTVRSRVLVFR